jgi:hypothetical protein
MQQSRVSHVSRWCRKGDGLPLHRDHSTDLARASGPRARGDEGRIALTSRADIDKGSQQEIAAAEAGSGGRCWKRRSIRYAACSRSSRPRGRWRATGQGLMAGERGAASTPARATSSPSASAGSWPSSTAPRWVSPSRPRLRRPPPDNIVHTIPVFGYGRGEELRRPAGGLPAPDGPAAPVRRHEREHAQRTEAAYTV